MRIAAVAIFLTCVTTLADVPATQPSTQPATAPARMTARQARDYVESLPEELRNLLIESERARRNAMFFDSPRVANRDKKRYAELQSRKTFFPPPLSWTQGYVGELVTRHIEVSQVVDEENLIGYSLSNYGRDRHYFWLQGYPTSGITDGQYIEPDGLWRIGGTKPFAASDGGKRTLMLVVPFEMPAIWTADVGKAVAKMVNEAAKRTR